MASDVIALTEHLGHNSISTEGLSRGVAAITAVLCRPKLFDRIVLLGTIFHYSSYPEGNREFITNYKWDGNTDLARYPGNFIEHYLTGYKDLSGFGDLLDEMALMWTTSPAFEKSELSKFRSKTLIINRDHEDTALEHAIVLYDGIEEA